MSVEELIAFHKAEIVRLNDMPHDRQVFNSLIPGDEFTSPVVVWSRIERIEWHRSAIRLLESVAKIATAQKRGEEIQIL